MTKRTGHHRPIRLIGVVIGVLTLASTACGATTAVVAKAKPTTSATAGPVSPEATLAPLPPPPPVGPLVSVTSDNNTRSFYSAAGKLTFVVPANFPYDVISPLGGDLLGEKTDPHGGVSALVAITATGAVTPLETIAKPADFIDAMGSAATHTWAWILRGTGGGCGGEPPPATTCDVYVSSTPGKGTKIATLPPIRAGVQSQFYRWTAAGIVLTQGGPPGCASGPRFNADLTALLNPTTGALTELDPKLGSDHCILQDFADDGTIACMPMVTGPSPPGPSTVVLRIVFPDGTVHNVKAAPFLPGCVASGGSAYGDVSLDSGSDLVAVTRYCDGPHILGSPYNQLIDTWIVDTETLNMAKVNVSELDAIGWIPGTSTLIEAGTQNIFPDVYATYAVAPNGVATKLDNADANIVSFAHEGF